MKKLVLILFLVLTQVIPLRAELVTPQTAARCAGSLLGVEGMPLPDNTDVYRAAGRGAQASYPEYYVCNYPGGGWAIIAADDRVTPVLAYSDSGEFDDTDMPENLKWWMEGVTGFVDAVRGSDLTASREVKAEWQRLLDGSNPQSNDRKVLETAFWHQDSPFNDLCPVVANENERAIVGCVATAMAIILRYNKWPEHGHGIIGGYTSSIDQGMETYIPAYSLDNHYYDWDNMPLTDSRKAKPAWTEEQKRQVAQLAYDCGVMVNMSYSSVFSGAISTVVLRALNENLGYESAVSIPRSNYSLDQWFSMIKQEIDQDRIVYYVGTDPKNGSHAFVCDGYETQGNMLHFNWGWGDIGANGFYSLDLILPEEYVFRFTDLQGAIIGIAPGSGLDIQPGVPPFLFALLDGSYGIRPTSEYIAKGSEIIFEVGYLQLYDSNHPDIGLKVCFEDKEGNIKQDFGPEFITFPSVAEYYLLSFDSRVLSVDPEFTDVFKLYIMTEDSVWVPMTGNLDLLPDQEYITCGVTRDPLILVEPAQTPGCYNLSLTQGFMPVKKVEWLVNDAICSEGLTAPEPGEAVIKAKVEYLDGTTGTICRTFLVE